MSESATVPAPATLNASLEIKTGRSHDGRYTASIPGLHPSCVSLGNTPEAAMRNAQLHAFNIMADFVRGNRPLPEAIKSWFFVSSKSTPGAAPVITNVGGSRMGDIPGDRLVNADTNTIPAKPRSRHKPALPSRSVKMLP